MVICELFVMVILERNYCEVMRPYFTSYNEVQIADLTLMMVVKHSLQ